MNMNSQTSKHGQQGGCAKGMLAERTGLDMSEAFRLMRLHARINGLRLSTVASSVINGTCDAEAILNH